MPFQNPFQAAADEYYPQTLDTPATAPIRAPASGKAKVLKEGVEAKQAKAAGGRALLAQLFAEQQDEVNKMREAAAAAEAQPLELNLAPLAALTDAWTGSKMAQSYQAPESPEEKAARVAKIRGLANQGQQDITKDQIQMMLGEGKDDTSLLRAIAAAAGSGTGDIKAAMLQWQKDKYLTEDLGKIEKGLEERTEQLDNIQAGLDRGDLQSLGTIVSQYARGVSGEKGVLTNEDIWRVMPKNVFKDLAGLEAYFSSSPAAEIKPEYLQGMKELTELARDRMLNKTDSYLQGHRKRLSALQSTAEMMQPGASGDTSYADLEGKVKKYRSKAELKRPAEVDQADWARATPEQKKKLFEHFNSKPKAK